MCVCHIAQSSALHTTAKGSRITGDGLIAGDAVTSGVRGLITSAALLAQCMLYS